MPYSAGMSVWKMWLLYVYCGLWILNGRLFFWVVNRGLHFECELLRRQGLPLRPVYDLHKLHSMWEWADLQCSRILRRVRALATDCPTLVSYVRTGFAQLVPSIQGAAVERCVIQGFERVVSVGTNSTALTLGWDFASPVCVLVSSAFALLESMHLWRDDTK